MKKWIAEIGSARREQNLTRLLRTLRGGSSVMLIGARGVGKTTLLRALIRETAGGDDLDCIYLAAEGQGDPPEALNEFLKTLQAALASKAGHKTRSLGSVLRRGVASLAPPSLAGWQRVFEDTIEVLSSTSNRYSVVCIDDFGSLLARLKPDDARRLLDLLRQLRMTFSNVLWLLAASQSLHPLLNELERKYWSASPINDLQMFVLDPLEFDDASKLASALLSERGAHHEPGVQDAIASASGGTPLVIVAFADALALRGRERPLAVRDVQNAQDVVVSDFRSVVVEVVRAALRGLSEAERPLARRIVGELTGSRSPVSLDGLFRKTPRAAQVARELTASGVITEGPKHRYRFPNAVVGDILEHQDLIKLGD